MSDEEEVDELITGKEIPEGMTEAEYIQLIKEDKEDDTEE